MFFHRSTVFMVFLALGVTTALGQGLSRSRGIGFRGGLWHAQEGGGFRSSEGLVSVTVEDIGGSGDVYFFSRLSGQWFLEMSLGGVGIGGVYSEIDEVVVESESMVTFLLGGRYDFLPERFGSTVAPYVSAGLGGYWAFQTQVATSGLESRIDIGGDLKTGYYVGLGINLAVTNWFFLNLDFKSHNVEFTPKNALSGTALGLGLGFMWGRKNDLFKVEEIKVIVTDIYPAYLPFYKTYPIAMVSVKSTVGFPIELNLKSSIRGFTERPSESGFIRFKPGERKDIPVKALFGKTLLGLENRQQAVLDLEIEARAGTSHRRTLSAALTMHHKNSWDGEIQRLPLFVTPEAPLVLDWVRTASDSAAGDRVRAVAVARRLADRLAAMGLRYRSDPRIPYYQDDRVQFAEETLRLGGGDCDDLSVLMASLLEGAGIGTAFVDVRDPDKPVGHVYLMMDTGLKSSELAQLTRNEKRVVLRTGRDGVQRVWLPLECTLLPQGFDAAWEAGAMAYLEEAVLRDGLGQGWVQIIDIQ